ncbi:MAG: ABC transporter substrate-binding protein [Stappiaceae bacterium]
MKVSRRIATTLFAGAALMAGSFMALPSQQALAAEQVDDKLYMVIAGRQPVSHLDPALKYDLAVRMMQQQLYDALVKYEGNPSEIKPWLAESWTTSEDGLTWTFTLAKNAKFHDGSPVNADAVIYSFKRTMAINEGPAWMLEGFVEADNIKALDEHTVEFKLNKPYAAFLSFLPWWYVLNPDVVEANTKDGDMGKGYLLENAAGSGPYTLERFEQGTAYVLKRNDDYWKGFPYDNDRMGGVIYRLMRESAAQRAALLKGEADIVTGLSVEERQAVEKREEIQTTSLPALTSFGLKMNTTKGITADVNIRKALAYAYDYDSFLQIMNGEAKLQTSPFTDAVKGMVPVGSMPTRDIEKAKEYLAKTDHPDGGFEIDYVYVEGFELERQMGLSMIDAFKDINVTVNMIPQTWPNMVALGSKPDTSPDLLAIFTTPVSTDPDAIAIQYHPSSHGKYYASHFLDDPDLNKMIEDARAETDWEKRVPIYAEIQQKIVDLQPEIFGMMRNRGMAHRTWVKGYEDSPIRMGGEIDFYPVHLDPNS